MEHESLGSVFSKNFSFIKNTRTGRGGSQAVAHRTTDCEVQGLIPAVAGSWAHYRAALITTVAMVGQNWTLVSCSLISMARTGRGDSSSSIALEERSQV